MSLTPRDLLDAARVRLDRCFPYYRAALFKVRLWERPGFGTFGIDAGGRLSWDPAMVEKWGVKATAAVFKHELGHFIRDHAGRSGDRDHMLWNIATDAEINTPNTFADEWALPGEAVTAAALQLPANETAEHYYAELMKRAQKSGGESPDESEQDGKAPGAGGRCGGCTGNPNPGEDESDPNGGAEQGEESGQGKGKGKGKSSGQKPQEAPEPMSPGELEVMRAKVAQDVKDYAGRNPGTVPGSMLEWAEEQLTPPVVPWEQQISKHVRAGLSEAAGAVDYTYRKLGRSYAARRAVMGRRTPIPPAMQRPVPKVALVCDSSGSMGTGPGSPLAVALSEVQGVIRATGAAVSAYACDAAAAAVGRVFSKESIYKLNSGHGGTDMRVGIAAADEGTPRPDVIILLTDGETPWPEPDGMPRARLVVGLVGDDAPQPPDHIDNVVRIVDHAGKER